MGERTVYHDVWCGGENAYGQIQGMPVYYEADPHLYRTALSVPAPVNLTGGLICTGDRFITDRTELEAIKNKFPEGLAVDMESCSMAQVCYLEKVPFLSFRVISDTPGVEKHELQYHHFWTAAPQESFEVFREFLNLTPNYPVLRTAPTKFANCGVCLTRYSGYASVSGRRSCPDEFFFKKPGRARLGGPFERF